MAEVINNGLFKKYGAREWLQRLTATSVTAKEQSAKVLRLYIAGDRSQVGKTSCCLGILSALLNKGYKPEEIAYIKPATQCEKEQPVVRFCEKKGIENIGIGPVVFYSGFTREFLKGNTEGSERLLQKISAAVDQLCSKEGRKIVIIDGVGFPAVGSIVGISNADVARVLNAPVLLICPKGVGNAIDSFNLNETFFRFNHVKVLGVIFNRFPLEGYYTLENCRESIMSYFSQFRSDVHVYGMLPELNMETSDADAIIRSIAMAFNEHVDSAQLLQDIDLYYSETGLSPVKNTLQDLLPAKRKSEKVSLMSRSEIERLAKAAGAKGG